MLQEGAPHPDLRRADQLAAGDEHLAACWKGEARRRMVEGGGGWWRMVEGQRGVHAKGPKRERESVVDRVVRFPQPAEDGDRSGDGVGDLVVVPHGSPARGPPDDIEAETGDRGLIVMLHGLVSSQ